MQRYITRAITSQQRRNFKFCSTTARAQTLLLSKHVPMRATAATVSPTGKTFSYYSPLQCLWAFMSKQQVETWIKVSSLISSRIKSYWDIGETSTSIGTVFRVIASKQNGLTIPDYWTKSVKLWREICPSRQFLLPIAQTYTNCTLQSNAYLWKL